MPFPSLYAILDLELTASRGLEPLAVLGGWLDAGVRLVQLRAKATPGALFLEMADAVVARCHKAGATLIINDRADIAKMSDADGVHVGQSDLSPVDIRRVFERSGDHVIGSSDVPAPIVGLSTHSTSQVEAALEQPIDYVAMGPVFSTATKDRPDPVVGLEGVRQAAAIAVGKGLPVVAIGGITVERARSLIDAGAASVAVISDLTGPDAYERARGYLAALS